MGKHSLYICNNCGAQYSSWAGKCSQCNEWNTIDEQLVESSQGTVKKNGINLKTESIAQSLKDKDERIKVDLVDIDSILGGGIVPGSIILIAGQPGIGKSTLLLQIASQVGQSKNVLYVSGEESLKQISSRAERLKLDKTKMLLASSNSADDIAKTIESASLDLVIIDSIQTISCEAIKSASGSVAQITNSTNLITEVAKRTSTSVIIVGHVTKDGFIAGPKVLEHLVDTVLQLEGDRYGGFKLLRAIKNRFGSINQTGIYEMTDKGLEAVKNPSELLLKERQVADGSIVHATIEGNRAILVEIQALVNTSSYGYPKRAASGFDLNRLNLLIAVLEKRTKLNLSDKDIYINVVGGMQIKDPSADLAICMAIASAVSTRKLKKDLVVYGEVGLSGEIRHVTFSDLRLAEALKLGFKGAVGPKDSKAAKELHQTLDLRTALIDNLDK